MIRPVSLLLALAICVPMVALAQYRVDSRNIHDRTIMVVPLVGSGTYDDPRRPLFAPASPAGMRAAGFHSFDWELSDDGKFAIVEFASLDDKPVRTIAKDTRILKSFQKGRAKRADIERELRVYKKDFKLDRFDRRPQ